MSFNRDPDVRPQLIHANYIENHCGLQNCDMAEHMICDHVRGVLAAEIANECVQKDIGKYSTEYRLDVYVLTADQLERMVSRRARALSAHAPDVMRLS